MEEQDASLPLAVLFSRSSCPVLPSCHPSNVFYRIIFCPVLIETEQVVSISEWCICHCFLPHDYCELQTGALWRSIKQSKSRDIKGCETEGGN